MNKFITADQEIQAHKIFVKIKKVIGRDCVWTFEKLRGSSAYHIFLNDPFGSQVYEESITYIDTFVKKCEYTLRMSTEMGYEITLETKAIDLVIRDLVQQLKIVKEQATEMAPYTMEGKELEKELKRIANI